jgi:hypothetical protein
MLYDEIKGGTQRANAWAGILQEDFEKLSKSGTVIEFEGAQLTRGGKAQINIRDDNDTVYNIGVTGSKLVMYDISE